MNALSGPRSPWYKSVISLGIGLYASQPLPREGRVWSTSHHGFVSVCHDFLGVLTTNDAHRHVVARAVHAYLYTNRAHAYSVWRAQNSPARIASRLTANSIELLLTPCTACPLLTLQHKLVMRS